MVNHSCKHCNYQSSHALVVRRHEKNKHRVHDYQHGSTTSQSIQRNQIGGSALTNSHQEQVFHGKMIPIEYYQKFENQLDHASSSNIQWTDAYKELDIQWQEAYKKLYEIGLELDEHLRRL